MSNFHVTGNLTVDGNGILKGKNIPTKISFSRYMRWEQTNNAQSGTQTCSFTSVYAGTSGNLAANEFISSVTLDTHGNAYGNNALSFMTSLEISDTQMKVGWYRDSNDNNNSIRIFAIVCKYE